MTSSERENWITNIKNTISFITSEIGNETVDLILCKYGANDIENITSSDFTEIFSELYAIEVELRSG